MTTSSTVVIIEVCPGSGYDTWNLNQTGGRCAVCDKRVRATKGAGRAYRHMRRMEI